MNKFITVSAIFMSSVIYSSQVMAQHVAGFIDEVVVRHKEGVVLISFEPQEYDNANLIGCASWNHPVGFEVADDPAGALYSLVMMSKMSGTKVFFELESNCLPDTGVADIREGRTGIN